MKYNRAIAIEKVERLLEQLGEPEDWLIQKALFTVHGSLQIENEVELVKYLDQYAINSLEEIKLMEIDLGLRGGGR